MYNPTDEELARENVGMGQVITRTPAQIAAYRAQQQDARIALRTEAGRQKAGVAALRARIGAEHKSLLSAGWDNLSVLPQDTTVNLARPNWQEAQQHLLQVEFRMQPTLLESCPAAATC